MCDQCLFLFEKILYEWKWLQFTQTLCIHFLININFIKFEDWQVLNAKVWDIFLCFYWMNFVLNSYENCYFQYLNNKEWLSIWLWCQCQFINEGLIYEGVWVCIWVGFNGHVWENHCIIEERWIICGVWVWVVKWGGFYVRID